MACYLQSPGVVIYLMLFPMQTPPRIPVISFQLLAPPLLLAMAAILALSVGRYPLAVGEVARFLLSLLGLGEMEPERFALLHKLVVHIRLPRVMVAMLVGAALATSGATYQAVFRNPLVSPGLLGVTAGASAGAALAILLGGPWWTVQALAFALGLAAVFVAVGVAQLFGRGSVIMLILGGILSGALFSSLLSAVKYAADPNNQLPTIVYWLMGNLGQANLDDLQWSALPILGGIALLCLLGRGLDALAMGDEEARTLGVPVMPLRYGAIALATGISALTVALAGMIGWIGLVAPHVARLLTGPENRRLIPASACLGAVFLLASDSLARNLFTTELPIGVVTELIGIPVFLLVLHRARQGWLN